jgi:hypothetical protein
MKGRHRNLRHYPARYRSRFRNDGTASYEAQKVEGHWRHGGVIVRENLVKTVIDAPDSLSNRRWMKQYKDRWRLKLKRTEL